MKTDPATFPVRTATRFTTLSFWSGGTRLARFRFVLSAAVLAVMTFTTPLARGQTYNWVTLAGNTGGPGYSDGSLSPAHFNGPFGVAADTNGNVYVADTLNCTIRKISSAGIVTTFAGAARFGGATDGAFYKARFMNPEALAIGRDGNMYIADTGNSTIRKITPTGIVSTLAGLAGSSGSSDGTGNAARFNTPIGLTVDTNGNVFVADSGNYTIRKITSAGVVTTVAGLAGSQGTNDGVGGIARFKDPRGVVVDGNGYLYVADTGNYAIRMITPAAMVTTLAGLPGSNGIIDDTGSVARFSFPCAITLDENADLYVTDAQAVRKITLAGVVTTLAGSLFGFTGTNDGVGVAARFFSPEGIANDGKGNLYVADLPNYTIRKVTTASGVVTTVSGVAGVSGDNNGPFSTSHFLNPNAVALDANGNTYVADSGNHTIRKITSAGVVTTFAGLAEKTGSTDGTGSTARFNNPKGVAVDTNGNLYVADSDNRTLRKITPAGVVTTLAGLAGSTGYADGTGSSARFYTPLGVAVDSGGNVYVVDNALHTIRKVTAAGVVTTLAGSPGLYGTNDGTGSSARFLNPQGIAVDANTNLYVADTWNNTIRKVTSAGVVTTLAGSPGTSGWLDANGLNAKFNNPTGVAVDTNGNIYVADSQNEVIRQITPAGDVTTLAGDTNKNTVAGTDGFATNAHFNLPSGLAIDSSGVIYVADNLNSTIRKLTPDKLVTTFAGSVPKVGVLDGTGTGAIFSAPRGIAVDALGNVYVGDSGIRKITSAGAVTTLGAAIFPSGVAVDSSGNIYGMADSSLRKVAPSGVVTLLAGPGTGASGFADGTGVNARFLNPASIAIDLSGNIYVADTGNNDIRKVSPAGVVTTLAGLHGSSGTNDGTGSAARFNQPQGVTVDANGNVFVADTRNDTIRKITPVGVVTTIAGRSGSFGFNDGVGSAARITSPYAVAVDGEGNLYVTDSYHLIRKITSAGVVTTIGGIPNYALSEDEDGTNNAARFATAWGIATDSGGNVYVADSFNYRIVRALLHPVITSVSPASVTNGSPGLTLNVTGYGFTNGATVLWAGNVRTTTIVSSTFLQATIPASDLVLAGGDISAIAVTVRNPDLTVSSPQAFTIMNPNISSSLTHVAAGGQATFVSTPPLSSTQAGVSASLTNGNGNQAVTVTAATYTSNPGSGTSFDVGSSYVDVKVSGASANNSMTSYFYYPATLTVAAETALALLYYTGTSWVTVKSSGGLPPTKVTTDNLDGTTSGGRFTVLFDSTSTPTITQLTGTPFALVLDTTPPVVTCPANIVTVTDPGQATAHVSYAPTATDNSGTATVVGNPPSGSAFALGTTTVNCTATDPSGNPANCSFTVTVNQAIPEIVVEQPPGTNLTDGAVTVDFGSSTAGLRGSTKTFVIKNIGAGNITGLAITRDGANASEFAVTANPMPPVGPNGSTAFTVQFNPASAGTKTAALHIANNDPDENPFDIALTGQTVLSPSPVLQVNDGSLGFSNGQFGFNVLAGTGQTLVVEASTNLVDWLPLGTNVPGATPLHFSDPGNYSRRFYRGYLLP